MPEVPLHRATRLLNHGPLVLVSTTDGLRADVAPVAWCMPVGKEPPRFALAIGSRHYTFENLLATGEAVLSVPGLDLAAAVARAGSVSGRDVPDKFAHAGLVADPSRVVRPPRVAGAVAWLECRLVDRDLAVQHGLVLVEAVWAEAREGAFREDATLDVARFPTLHHLGGDRFAADLPLD